MAVLKDFANKLLMLFYNENLATGMDVHPGT